MYDDGKDVCGVSSGARRHEDMASYLAVRALKFSACSAGAVCDGAIIAVDDTSSVKESGGGSIGGGRLDASAEWILESVLQEALSALPST